MLKKNTAELNDEEIRCLLATEDGKKELLGDSEGVATSLKGDPQTLYRWGLVTHRRRLVVTDPLSRRPYDEVTFDRGPLAGRSFEI